MDHAVESGLRRTDNVLSVLFDLLISSLMLKIVLEAIGSWARLTHNAVQ